MTYDFRHLFGLSLNDLGEGYDYGEALSLVQELAKDQGSRFFASLQGWSYPMSRQEMYSGLLLTQVANALRGEKDEPFRLDWPWPDEPQESVSDEERAIGRARLKAHSAFAQVRAVEAAPSE